MRTTSPSQARRRWRSFTCVAATVVFVAGCGGQEAAPEAAAPDPCRLLRPAEVATAVNLPPKAESFDVNPPPLLSPRPVAIPGMRWCYFFGGPIHTKPASAEGTPGAGGGKTRLGPHVWVGVATVLAPEAFAKWRRLVPELAGGVQRLRMVPGVGREAVLDRDSYQGPSLVVLDEGAVVAITIDMPLFDPSGDLAAPDTEANTLDRQRYLARKVLERL